MCIRDRVEHPALRGELLKAEFAQFREELVVRHPDAGQEGLGGGPAWPIARSRLSRNGRTERKSCSFPKAACASRSRATRFRKLSNSAARYASCSFSFAASTVCSD